MSILSQPQFHDGVAAFAFLEGELWPRGPVCAHCQNADAARITKVKANPVKRIRVGLWRCGVCKKQFRVTLNTVFEHARIPLHKVLQAVYLMCCSKKGVSSHRLHRILEVQYRTAWFLAHRIREAMRSGELAPMGGAGGTAEVDETFIGRQPGRPVKRAYHHKMKAPTLVDRETKQARSMAVDNLKPSTIAPLRRENTAKEARLATDEAGHYLRIGRSSRTTASCGREDYVVGQVHTNTIEGYFSILKRGMKGVYQHCGKQHRHRYLAEFDSRYNHRIAVGFGDVARTSEALRGTIGKRLTYRDSSMRAPGAE